MSPEIQQRMIEMTLFPVSQEAFDDYMNKAMHPEFRNASEDSALDGSDKSSVSEDCVNRLRIIVDSLNVTNETDYILGNIIIEECLPAVNGQKSAAETAEVLSDRINLYLQSR
jgi:ABC-type glycerol-3-phosphate transport system substrate-binding protein